MLMEFFGEECPHCLALKPMIERLKKEEGVTIESFEVWHNDDNAKKLEEIDCDLCGGVPFLYNTETKKFICGEATYEEMKDWALCK